jgi:phage tail-like protein
VTAQLPFGNMRFRVDIDTLPSASVCNVLFPEGRIVAQGTRGKRAPRLRYGALILRRGLTRADDWYRWWHAAREGRRQLTRAATITLIDERGMPGLCWTFAATRPVAYQVSELRALGSELLTETLELAIGSFSANSVLDDRLS